MWQDTPLALALLAMVVIVSVAARAESRMERIAAAGALRVCIWPDYYGIAFRNPKTLELSGIDIDLAHELAKDLGAQAQFVDSSCARLIDAVTNNRCDIAMVELAELLRAQIRPTDIVCRIGGEEFLLMLPNLPLGAAVERAEQLRQAFATMPIGFGEQVLGATVSIGLAGYPEHGDTFDSLIRRADEAPYVARREGRNRVAIAPLLFTESGKPLPSLPIDTDYP